MPFHALESALATHILTQLRDTTTDHTSYRNLTRTLTSLLVAEATKHLPTKPKQVATPLESMEGAEFTHPFVAIPILRAGLGMLDAVQEMLPQARVGYIGLQRDEETAIAHTYYCKLPRLTEATALLLDPMLATGGSAAYALEEIQKHNPAQVLLLCAVAAPEGVEYLTSRFPNVEIFAGALDRELNTKKYICPGLGDFGDRLFGTT
jgi:uracil phosphoribosyltransferase